MTVTGVDDNLVDGTISSTITIAVVDESSNDGFDAVADQTVTATTTDDDVAGFTIAESGGSTSVDESGTTDTFTIVLDAQPTSDVVFAITSSDTGEATVTSTLTFTNGNWDTPQTVTVTGATTTLSMGVSHPLSPSRLTMEAQIMTLMLSLIRPSPLPPPTTTSPGSPLLKAADQQASPNPEPPTRSQLF